LKVKLRNWLSRKKNFNKVFFNPRKSKIFCAPKSKAFRGKEIWEGKTLIITISCFIYEKSSFRKRLSLDTRKSKIFCAPKSFAFCGKRLGKEKQKRELGEKLK